MANENDLFYRLDIYNAIYKILMEYLAQQEIPSGLIHNILKTINEMPSTFWNPCTDEDGVSPKGEEVLVSLAYPNGKTEVAFGAHYGDNIDQNIAFWGGQNGLVKAWAKVPEAYKEE